VVYRGGIGLVQAGFMAGFADDGRVTGPLVLGAGGRLGQGWQRLWSAGLWPAQVAPLWQARKPLTGCLSWDLLATPAPNEPRIAAADGVIVLAGVTAGDASALSRNTDLALAAIRLAAERGIGPVLLCSSAAVYGRTTGACSEASSIAPVNSYGAAKAAMEAAVGGIPGVTCLRIANVAGADMLLTTAARQKVSLDRFADGSAPRRAYIGPVTLAQTMLRLIALSRGGRPLPAVLNVACEGSVGMDEILTAAGLSWDWTPAPDTALPQLDVDTTLLQRLAPIPAKAGTATALIAEARAAGWTPAP
jgi:nucleoside-diphosphate-sugar epimerase